MTLTTDPLTTDATDTSAAVSQETELVAAFLVLAVHPGEGTGWHLVGRYVDFDAAVAGRIDDVLERLEDNDGWLVTCEHLIVGPDLDGSVRVWPQVASLGADPSSDRIPDPYDREAWRGWLEQSHRPVQ